MQKALMSSWKLKTVFRIKVKACVQWANHSVIVSRGQLAAVHMWVLRLGKDHAELSYWNSMIRGCHKVSV